MDDRFLKANLAQTTPFPFTIEVERAEGSWIYAKDGKRYLDMISGLAVSNFGHQHPIIMQSIREQMEKHLHVMVYGEFQQDIIAEAAKELVSLLPSPLDTVYFVNSGAEAIEAALKLAKRVTGKTEMISFRGSYHGSTHGAMSVSGNEGKKRAFRPLLPDVRFLKHNALEDLEQISTKTACVILETIQGDAGIRIPDLCFMQALRTKCSETGALLILDEIQAGMGRTGKAFAFEHYGIQPDILVLGKALGGGMPIGAIVSAREHMEQFTYAPMLGHITTFGGHPLACAGAYGALEALKKIHFEEVEDKGERIEKAIAGHHKVVEIRRKGMFFAIELTDAETTQKVVHKALELGIIGFWFLSCPEAFRIAPPLNISTEEVDWAIERILEALNDH